MIFILLLLLVTSMIISVLFYIKKIYKRKKSKELLIFSRYPTPGTTKTRLIPELGEDGAAQAQLFLTNHILDNVEQYSTKDEDVATIVYYNGGTDKQMRYWLGKRKCDLSWQRQASGGLGVKLSSAFKDSFNRGSKYTVIIGSDIPGINHRVISEAYQKLQNGSSMVLGPAADGGYYLVGISKAVYPKLDEVFTDITWGTETVFKEQYEKAKSLEIPLETLETVLHDIDEPEDLHFMETDLRLNKSQLISPKLSIIIPVYNEADNIFTTLQTIVQNCINPKLLAEIIVSDGGSTDDTVSIVEKFAKTTDINVTVVNSPPGRGYQLKYGTQHATGDHLMFLHADTKVPKSFDQSIVKCLRVPGNVAGAFEFSLDVLEIPERKKEVSSWFLWKMKFLALWTRMRVRNFELPYGDQILFTTRQNYDRIGGFKQVYLMEDFLLVQDLRKIGHIGIADAGPAITSSRRWENWGLIRVTGLNNFIVLAYKLGVSPDTLAEWYYGDKLKDIKKRSKEP